MITVLIVLVLQLLLLRSCSIARKLHVVSRIEKKLLSRIDLPIDLLSWSVGLVIYLVCGAMLC